MTGVMLVDAVLLGTQLRLSKGQRVRLVEATNLPDGGYFASPEDGSWGEDSIHITVHEVELCE